MGIICLLSLREMTGMVCRGLLVETAVRGIWLGDAKRDLPAPRAQVAAVVAVGVPHEAVRD